MGKFDGILLCTDFDSTLYVNGALIVNLDGTDKIYESFVEDGLKKYHFEICKIPEVKRFNYFTPVGMVKIPRKEFSDSLISEHMKKDIYKLTYTVSAEDSDAVLAGIKEIIDDRYVVTRSSMRGREVQNAYDIKGAAVKRLASIVGARTIVCVGDFENDISMVKEADIGYAVGNACDSLKAVADRITVAAEAHALARIIEELENNN